MDKVAFVFPGQGSQYVGMGQDFYNKGAIDSQLYDYAEKSFDFSLKEISFYGPLKELTQTKVTQPAIFVHSVATFEELKSRGYKPDMVAGHSLGEYSALVAAEVISFEDGIKLVKARSEAMQETSEKNPGTMAAIIGLDSNNIENVLKNLVNLGICVIANYNSPLQIVISGEINAVQSSMLELKKAGAKLAIELTVGGAFHSPLMEKAKEKLKETLDAVNFKPPKYPVYSNVSGTPTSDPEEIKDRLYKQITSPVLWTQTIENMIKDGADYFLEVGPGKVLQGLIKKINPKVTVKGISNFEELEKFEWN